MDNGLAASVNFPCHQRQVCPQPGATLPHSGKEWEISGRVRLPAHTWASFPDASRADMGKTPPFARRMSRSMQVSSPPSHVCLQRHRALRHETRALRRRGVLACALAFQVAVGACRSSDSHGAPKVSAQPRDSSAARPAATAAPQPTAADARVVEQAKAKTQAAKAEPSEPVTSTDTEAVLALPGSHSASIGGPSSGQVRGAVALPDRGPGYYHNPARPYAARFGTVELVQSIMRAAANVDKAMPGSVLVVNDLGLEEGGPIRQHGSHQAGRDADILFYSVDDKGKPLPSVGVPIDPKGKGTDFKDLAEPSDDQQVALDVPRTWRFFQELIAVTQGSLQRMFIVEHVRSMLLAEAARVHAPKDIVQRFADMTCQPEYPHDDHVHIRLYCTPEDMVLGCRDSAPNYPHRVAALAALGLTPLMAAPRSTGDQKASSARKTTPEEAKKKAGPMHALVTQFLKQREAWLKRPSPGRPYCK